VVRVAAASAPTSKLAARRSGFALLACAAKKRGAQFQAYFLQRQSCGIWEPGVVLR
jgi:hypothetical protein